MITEEEKQEIINLAVERAMLTLPEVVGNLMQQQAANHRLNSEFYKAHPEFRDHKDAVMSVVEQVEGKNPLKKYEDILTDAVPLIKQRIETMKGLDMKTVNPAPKRTFTNGEV